MAKADGRSQRVSPTPRPPAEPAPDGEAKEVDIYVRRSRHSYVVVELFPTKGVAVVATQAFEGRTTRSVSYAIQVHPAPFEGSVDLNFHDLGRIVGTVTEDSPLGPAALAERCESGAPGESATFEGRLAFRGAGGYGHWKATKAEANIGLACGARPRRENGTDALFEHLDEFGPVLNGPAPIRLEAYGEQRHHRSIRLFAWGTGSARGYLEYDAVDREWLPGGIATDRWTKREGASPKTLTIRGEGESPAAAVADPPAPFFGRGTFRRATGELTGSIGVSFLGLKLHLVRPPLTASLTNEDLR